jgi:aldoxime dehydratase
MESAIPEHLRCPRSQARRAPDDYVPPVPAWVARFDASVSRVAIACFGVQYRGSARAGVASAAIRRLVDACAAAGGPQHHDVAHHVDEAGYETLVLIAYWRDVLAYQRWWAESDLAMWWTSPEREREGVGYFREIFTPRAPHLETLFSSPDRFEGVGMLAASRSDQIYEHGYWGGARDRLPLAQTDGLAPGGAIGGVPTGSAGRIVVRPPQHLAVIRSGQDWSDTEGREREIYLGDVEPVLNEGMTFLRDHGRAIGCFANRYMRHVDGQGLLQRKSFGLSFWRSLAHLEIWAGSHPTHVAIFGSFMRMVKVSEGQLRLRLYHEVIVLAEDEQSYEYVNCHPMTRMLRAIG